jgi:hypothetical protein
MRYVFGKTRESGEIIVVPFMISHVSSLAMSDVNSKTNNQILAPIERASRYYGDHRRDGKMIIFRLAKNKQFSHQL